MGTMRATVRTLFLAALIGLVFGEKKLYAVASNCTKDSGYETRVTDITIVPKSPEAADQNFSMIATAIASKTISEGEMKLSAKLFGVTVLTERADLCAAKKYSLPAGAGSVYWQGVRCPIQKGSEMNITFVSDISKSTPDAIVKMVVIFEDTKTKKGIMCLHMDIKVSE